jgi:DNA-binding MarR family transcriptional regulator
MVPVTMRSSQRPGLRDAERQSAADELLSTMASIRRTGRRVAERPAELSALTGAQLELARLVRRRPGISIAEAASELRLAPNTVSTLVRRLTDTGLMFRLVGEPDRRIARLELSADLRHRIDAWRDRRVVALGASIGRLPAGDQRLLLEALPVLGRLADQLAALGGDR